MLTCQVSVSAPGAYSEVGLPCVPDVDLTGIATVKFSVGESLAYISLYLSLWLGALQSTVVRHLT